jgi:hypothetical protein
MNPVVGAEFAAWSKLPKRMQVHTSGLRGTRNAFLQPEGVVELLDDHRLEFRTSAERLLRPAR